MTGSLVKAGYWFTHTDNQLPSSNIDAKLFTHLFCGHAGLDSSAYNVTTLPLPKTALIESFSSTVKLSNPDVKTLLSIGGEDATAAKTFSLMANEPKNRASFIASSIATARKGMFDGLDLQWLYPSSQNEMDNLKTLLTEWRAAVVAEVEVSHLPQLLLVATVFYLPYLGTFKYPIDTMKKTLDWVNVISYDYYTPSTSLMHTGPSSAFYNPRTISVSASFGIGTWTEKDVGLPPEKIVFGIPFHGWAWELESYEEHDVFSKAKGAAQGQGIAADGLTDYRNIKKFMKDNDARNVPVEPHYIISYTYCGPIWIAYEDENTIDCKMKAAKQSKLLGYFAWNLAGDENDTLAIAAFKAWENA